MHAVEQIDKALSGYFRQGLPHLAANQVALTDQLAISGVRHAERVVGPLEDSHEAGGLFEERFELVRFLCEVHDPRLNGVCPLHQTHFIAHRAQALQFGHVHRMLQNGDHLALFVQKGRVRRAPVAHVHFAIGPHDVVANERDFVRLPRAENLLEGMLEQSVAFGIRIAGKGIEHAPAKQIFPLAHGYAQIGVVHPDHPKLSVEQHIRVGRTRQKGLKIDRHKALGMSGA